MNLAKFFTHSDVGKTKKSPEEISGHSDVEKIKKISGHSDVRIL